MVKEPLSAEQEALERRHKQVTIRASIVATLGSSIAILTALFPLFAWFGRAAIVESLSEAMGPAINAQVKQQTNPMNEGLKALIRSRIAQLEDDIADLQRRDRIEPLDAADTQKLVSRRRELRDQQVALAAIENAEVQR